jgi:hypothetical protein
MKTTLLPARRRPRKRFYKFGFIVLGARAEKNAALANATRINQNVESSCTTELYVWHNIILT